MIVSKKVKINNTKEKVWAIITDIEHSSDFIGGITDIEIITPAGDDLVGLKWKETRRIFGKESYEVMWITEYQQNHYYKTRAENHGAIYVSCLTITEDGDSVILEMSFEGRGTTFISKTMSKVFGNMMKKSMGKTLEQDLQDIKQACEAQ
ncbi:hypothetical protein GCM10022378_09930 [Salinicoccus jeotgali]|uniref:SRPBCC family protein n=1 Tax=Salinicoccus jeotgali TaxID=381634 RepID=A0ABP7ERE9_9STAP